LKFIAYKDGKAAKDFVLSSAYVFGADSVPLRGSRNVRSKDGVVEFDGKGNETIGLSLMWTANGFGKIQLCTTRLIDRQQPYILNVELARAKLMQIVVKREEWSLFDGNDKIAAFAHQAQGHFVDALKVINNPAKASILADRSLRKALIFSERLAARNAEFYLSARVKNKGLGRHSLGCKIDPELLANEKYRKRLFEMFCFVTIPIKWAKLEPEQGKFDFSSIDKALENFSGRRLAVCAGPLLHFSKDHLPDWLNNGKMEFEKIRESAYKFVTELVGRYYGKIHAWHVISGINAVNCFNFNFEQIMEMTRTACLAARTADPKSKSRKIVEIFYPWGEYYATKKDTIPPLVYADMVIQNGVPIDAFGVKMHFGIEQPGCQVRDMMHISSRLDCFSSLGKPLHITGVAIPGGSDKTVEAAGGVWHKEWSPQVQAEWIEQFYKIALGKNFIQSVTYSALADSPMNEVHDSGLVDSSLAMKKAYISVGKLQKVILKK
jgi:GH35 family endo-1,4-beta-xylanase